MNNLFVFRPLFFIDVPNVNNLVCVIVKVINVSPEESSRQKQILKCRELIFTEPTIIATPLLYSVSEFQVILQKEEWQTHRFQTHLERMDLQVLDCRPATNVGLQSCLQYTIKAKLAPKWNQVGNLLVEGREFLQCFNPLVAVRSDVIITDKEAYVSVEGFSIRIRPPKAADFYYQRKDHSGLSEKELHELNLQMDKCFILPSMKQGQLVSISQNIPSYSPFQGYKDIKKYWKNMYGYRLPKEEIGIFYVNVEFWGLLEGRFTYPSLCVQLHDIFYIPRVDPQPIISAFLEGLRSKVKQVCGEPFTLKNTTAVFPQIALQPSSDIMEAGNKPSLISCQTPELSVPLRRAHPINLKEVTKSSELSQSDEQITSNKKFFDEGNGKPVSNELIVPIFKPCRSVVKKIHNFPPIHTSNGNSTKVFNHDNRNLTKKKMDTLNKTSIIYPSFCVSSAQRVSQKITPNLQVTTSSSLPKIDSLIECDMKKIFNRESNSSSLPKVPRNIKEPKSKKPRKQSTENVDVISMAKGKKLNKLSVPVLLSWLRQKGVTYKSKDKKLDIIQRVEKYLQLTAPEQ
ncbi:uncharacterized protein C18orf63-like [Tachypleus tridentatus]|uniref:uncharacterized protein C18orf63-like n=1 Tax=Tachypleus tridentatus TaxID=6853 RepID=UPI003FD544DB